MINYTTLIPEFLELVGFRETEDILLPDSLKTSDSGLYLTSLNSVSLEVIKGVINERNKTLTSGELTIGKWYKITDNDGSPDFTTVGAANNDVNTLFAATATTPTWGTTTAALETQPIIDYLYLLRNDEIQSIMRQWVSLLQQQFSTKEVKFDGKVVNEYATVKQTQRETAKGFYINLSNSNSLELQLKSISLHLDAVDTVRLYLYEVGKTQAIQTFDYTSQKDDVSFQLLTDWLLRFQDAESTNKEYLLLYYDYDPDNIQAAIQLEVTTKYYIPPTSWYRKNSNMFRYVCVLPVWIQKTFWNWNATTTNYDIPNLENRSALSFNHCSNIGLNIDLKVNCEIANVLIDNKHMFAKMIQLAYAVRILNDAITSQRANRTKRNTDEYVNPKLEIAMAELFGNKILDDKDNLKTIDGEILRVVKNFKSIDCECFIDKTNNGLQITNTFQNTY